MKHDEQSIEVDREKYDQAIDYLYGLQLHGIKFGLSNIRRILALLGNPQNAFKAIHIAGTNGKGSTSSFIASVLHRAGCKVGLFTSPHLVSFTERIRINNVAIRRSDVVNITNTIRDLIRDEEDLAPTFFEFVTAMAFLYFKMMHIQWAVVETGMGGRLDATNILNPKMTVITRIAMDHTEFLGHSLPEIAGEKAGIIKERTPVILGLQDDAVEDIIRQAALLKESPVDIYGRDFRSLIHTSGIKGSRFDYVSERKIGDLYAPLCGEFQVENASLAIRAIERLKDLNVNEIQISDGLSHTRWEGRCELHQWKFPILFDGAHNLDAAINLKKTLKSIHLKEFKDIILLVGSMGDKDLEGLLSVLLPMARLTVFVTLNFERAAVADTMKRIADARGATSIAAANMEDAFVAIESHFRNGDLVVVTGSFYTVGEAKGLTGADSSLIGLTEFR